VSTRRTAIVALAVTVIAMILVPDALARAGGGSAGFGGGGGGGGFGGGGTGHGKSFAIYVIFRVLFDILIFGHGLGALFLIGLALIAAIYFFGWPRVKAWFASIREAGRANRKASAKRERKVELAAAEAEDDDPIFGPTVVRAQAAQLFMEIQSAWDRDDRIALRGLVAPELLAEWELRLDDFERRGWHNHVEPLGEPQVQLLGLTHRGTDQDSVTVRIEARVKDYVTDRSGAHMKRRGRISDTSRIREFWTLRRRGEHWILLSIEQGAEGSHALTDDIVATAWSDDASMRDEALVEQAIQDAAPNPGELVSVGYDGDAQAAANDLSVADGRFSPDVLEVAARRATAAWAQAVDGSDELLMQIAHPDAAREMLYPGPGTRLVVRGPQVRHIQIVALDAAATPPTMTIEVQLAGRRYIEDRNTTAVLSGDRSKLVTFTERWTMALDGPAEQPWRIAVSRSAAVEPA